MEAFSNRFPPFKQRLYTLTSSPPPPRHSLHGVPNLRRHGGFGRRSSMRFPSLQRITTALNQSHQNQVQFSLRNTTYLDLSFDFNFYNTMADSDAKKEIQSADGLNVVKDTKETKKSPEIPPPPEKPLPGDCCGSGCVRCVWDIYYDELEEYNKLLKGESDSTVGPKVS
ncbi:hypothetical protein L2E82_18374 [Cichorium intybus]|uniref:Uncharacterized protein n=1 Tax=Cichorium intybus TaxID=13427 RepID=A0ACB9FAT7_CICIN|nr:hypothetical protein L2E82_18374 [Cichorium intybus]